MARQMNAYEKASLKEFNKQLQRGSKVKFTDKWGYTLRGTLSAWTAIPDIPGVARVNVPNHPTMGDVNCLVQQSSLILVK
jgi:hypothetical protein